jgi:peptidoglycan hydrolase-like protein with peptidoglycan-binding domain
MTKTSDFASKAAIAFVAIAMVFGMVATPAKAHSAEDLQKMINDLLAQVAALQGQGGTSSSVASGICPFTWTRDLKTGATGADVMKLQQFLNANADTRVAASGAGSVGAETQTFGPATAAAVSKFQVMHRADILTPAGLTNPTGFFGPGTRAKVNSLCTSSPVDEDEDEDEDTESGDLSGEASLDTLDIESASDDEIEEGEEDAEIATVNVEFTDGDASISRLDVSVTGVTDAWDVLDTVTLWVDGDMVAEMDASDEDEYQDEDNGTIRFSGLDIVAMEDEELEIVIAATIQSSIDSLDLGTYSVSADTIRYFDADDVATTEEATDFELGETVTFSIDEAGAEDELIAKTSTSDLDGSTIQVEDDSKSDFETVFIFDLDTDDSVNDIELNTVVVNVTTDGTVAANAGYDDLVDDAELVIDGVTIDDVVVTGVTLTEGVAILTFDVDGDVTIDAGDRVAAELKLRFKALPTGEEGATVVGSIAALTTLVVDAQGADDLGNTQLSGSATGDVHTLRTAGVDVVVESVDADVTTQDLATNDYATYVVEVEVTAFEQDAYFSTTPGTSFAYVLENGASVVATTGSQTVSLTSTADEQGAYFLVNEGETETFTLTVTYVPGVVNTAARMQLVSTAFAATAIAPNQTWTASPEEDYRTAVVTVVN